MRRPAALFFVALGLSACGDLSNDDLLFLAAMPRADELRVGPDAPAGSAAALVGEPAAYYGMAVEIAGFFDAVVGEALAAVAALGWGYPPTERHGDARIWGPVADVDGAGTALRLEIRRDQASTGEEVFSYCLHLGQELVSDGREVSCATPAARGLRLLLWGSFTPEAADAEGRAGRGELSIDFDVAGAVQAEEPARGLLHLDYDFTGGGAARVIHIAWVTIESLSSPASHRLTYDLVADEDEHQFQFSTQADVFAPGGGTVGSTSAEQLAVAACWATQGLGRADVVVSGGDLSWGQHAESHECWDAVQARTYYSFALNRSSVVEEEGDPGRCPAPCSP